MKKYLSSLIFFISIVQVFAQNDEFEWCRSFGGIGTDEITCSVLDNKGNTLFAGYFFKELHLDNYYLKANGDYDAFVAKIDVNGNILWAKSMGGGYDEDNIIPDYAVNIFIDKSNNVYLLGIVHSCLNIDTFNLKYTASSDIFLIKINPHGKILWAESFGNETNDMITDAYYNEEMVIFSGNHIVLNALNKFEPVSYIVGTNSNGNILWQKEYDFTHHSSKIIVSTDKIFLDLEVDKNQDTENRILKYIYDKTGNLISSVEENIVKKISKESFQNSIIFSNDTLFNDTMLFSKGSWQTTGILDEFNNIKVVMPGKVINILKSGNEEIFTGNYYKESVCNDKYDFSSLDFFITKSVTVDYRENEKNTIQNEIKIFPNPSLNEFNLISSSNIGEMDISIFNTYNQIVREYNSITLPFSFSVDETGIYFIKLVIGEDTLTQKIVKL